MIYIFFILLILKLSGVIVISWWWVWSPILFCLALVPLYFLAAILGIGVVATLLALLSIGKR